MLIRSVSLEDIKSYSSATVDFQPGTNAISGVNGAGKSTILEAIGYALFDYKPYKIESMVRHGQKKGEIRVRFVGVDGRNYEVVRTVRTKGGTAKYLVNDLDQNTKIVDAKDDQKEGVLKALRKDILGIPVGVDGQTLFQDVIGVPQGTIIAPFLDTPSQRKEKFDPILGINEYKVAYDGSSNIAKIIERKVQGLREKIALLSGRLDALPIKKEELLQQKKEIASIGKKLEEEERVFKEIFQKKEVFERRKSIILELEAKHQDLITRLNASVTRKREYVKDQDRAKGSVRIVETSKPHYLGYLKAEKQLAECEGKRKDRDRLQQVLQSNTRSEAGLKERISSLMTSSTWPRSSV